MHPAPCRVDSVDQLVAAQPRDVHIPLARDQHDNPSHGQGMGGRVSRETPWSGDVHYTSSAIT